VVLDSSDAAGRSIAVFNAGSSTELGCARVFTHSGGVVLGRHWMHAQPPAAAMTRPAIAWSSALQRGSAGAHGLV
jgi:hypothetical protein